MIEKPKFWRWARLRVDKDNYQEVLQSTRVNIVGGIKISTDNFPNILNILENILTAVLEGHSQLKKLEVRRSQRESEIVDLSSLDPALLSQALVRLEECRFNHCSPLSTAQLVSIFTEIEQTNNLKLKSLYLGKAPK